ncbi:pentapeptide repeat-containing protein [Zhihengliuella somnathii]
MTSTAPKPPRLPAFTDPGPLESGDLTALPLDGRAEELAFTEDDAAGLDLEDTVYNGCTFRRVGLAGARLTRAAFNDCRLTELNAPTLEAPDSEWTNTHLSTTRIGSAELYGASLRATLLEAGKLDFVNLRQARLRDVEFRGLVFGDLDLGSAQLERVRFTDCRIGTLTLNHARLKDVDLRGAELHALSGLAGLRGATISGLQLQDLAPALATHVGLTVA